MLNGQRLQRMTLLSFAVATTWFGLRWIDHRLGDPSTFTGLILLFSTLSLYLLNWRKKVISDRVGPVSRWLRVHSYVGAFACIVFLTHINWPITGAFETCLAAAFVFVSGSGIVLAVMSRITPRRLAAIRQEYRLEQIPEIQFAVARDAHEVAMSSTQIGEGATLSEYYQRRLLPYFQTPRSLLYRWLPNGQVRRQLLRELEDLDRYLAQEGLKRRRRLSAMVQSKDDLDYHRAVQLRLRYLYAAHFALTWTLLILIGVHVVLAIRFSGTWL